MDSAVGIAIEHARHPVFADQHQRAALVDVASPAAQEIPKVCGGGR